MPYNVYLKKIFQIIYKPLNILVISVIIFIFSLLISPNNIESAKSVLGAIIQSLASILAIVISLTIVAVQLSAQNYTPRILKMFVSYNNYYFWGLITLYLASIIYSLLILNIISNSNSNLFFVNLSIFLTILSLMFIPKYIVEILESLGPETVIKALSEGINEDFISELEKYDKGLFTNYFYDLNRLPSDKDILIPLMDIIVGAIENGHTDTAKAGLRDLGNRFLFLVEKEIINDRNGRFIFDYFLDHIKRAEKVAINKSDTKNIELIMIIVDRIGNSIARKAPDSYQLMIMFFEKTSENIIDINTTLGSHLIIILKNLSLEFLKKSYSDSDISWNVRIISVIDCLNSIWIKSINERKNNIKLNLEMSKNDIMKKIIERGFKNLIWKETLFLMDFGIYAAENNPELFDEITMNLHNLFIISSNEGFAYDLNKYKNACKTLNFINIQNKSQIQDLLEKYKIKKEKEWNNVLINIIEALKFMGITSIEKETHDFKISSYYPIEEIISIEDTPISKIIRIFEKIGQKQIIKNKYNFKNANFTDETLERVINHLGTIGLELANKRSNLVFETIKSLFLIITSLIESLDKPNRNNIFLNALDLLKRITEKMKENNFERSEIKKILSDFEEFNDLLRKKEINDLANEIGKWQKSFKIIIRAYSTK